MKNKEYFSAKMGIYPRTLFIVKGKNKQKVIRDNFMARTGDELTFNDKNIPVEACEWEVIEKKSNIHGFLVWIDKNVSFNAIVHESTHVAFETFRDIGGIADEDNQEPFAYLIGWIAGQIKNA